MKIQRLLGNRFLHDKEFVCYLVLKSTVNCMAPWGGNKIYEFKSLKQGVFNFFRSSSKRLYFNSWTKKHPGSKNQKKRAWKETPFKDGQ